MLLQQVLLCYISLQKPILANLSRKKFEDIQVGHTKSIRELENQDQNERKKKKTGVMEKRKPLQHIQQKPHGKSRVKATAGTVASRRVCLCTAALISSGHHCYHREV